MLYKKKRGKIALLVCVIVSAMYYFLLWNNSSNSFVYDTPYQNIEVRDITIQWESWKVFHTNWAYASAIFTKTKESPFQYIRETVEITKVIKPKNVLVIGTAGFTYPNEIARFPYVENIDTVDIDPAVKWIAEEYFLEQPLPEKITFYDQSARYFVHEAIKQWKKYDMIFVDAFNGKYLPDELITQEFYRDLAQLSEPKNIVLNMILDNQWTSDLSKNITTTMNSVRWETYSKIVSTNDEAPIVNHIVMWGMFDSSYSKRLAWWTIYTDDKRTSEVDLVTMQDWDN